jgi:hypothetical protein
MLTTAEERIAYTIAAKDGGTSWPCMVYKIPEAFISFLKLRSIQDTSNRMNSNPVPIEQCFCDTSRQNESFKRFMRWDWPQK